MRIEKEFTVAAPLDRAWEQLADGDALASCLPDARLPGVAREQRAGREVILALNGTGAACRATLRAVDADEDERSATIRLAGREIAGPGIGRGTIQGRLTPADGATRVQLVADVELTGRAPAPEAVEGTARRLLDGFAERLEQGMLDRAGRPEPAPSRAARPDSGPAPAADRGPAVEPEPEGVLSELLSHPAARYGAGAGVVLLLLALLRALLAGGRGNRASFSVRFRW